MEEIELGDRVIDRISKQQGIVIGITKWLYGCVRVTIQPEEVKDNKPVEGFSLDLPQCALVAKGIIKTTLSVEKDPGGPRPNVSRGRETNKERRD